MYCATPSVTTDIGAESMQTHLPWAGAIANDPQAIADAAVKLYQDDLAWQTASDLGQQNAQLMYQQESVLAELVGCLSKLENNLRQHRQANFIGSMLNHHHHKSTQYMSQWIDVKTQLKELVEDTENK
jgi:hypothetical protein